MKLATKKIIDGHVISVPQDSKLHKSYLELRSLDEYFQYHLPKYDHKKNRIGEGVILDIGCNIGLHSMIYRDLGYKNKIIAIDAIDSFSRITKKNFDDNNIKNYEVITAALAKENGPLDFFLPFDNFGETSYIANKDNTPGIRVKTQSINAYDFLKGLKLKQIGFVKIDIEGAEIPILDDMFRYFQEMGNPSVRIESWGTFSGKKNWLKLQKEHIKIRKVFYEHGYKLQKRIHDDFFLVKGSRNRFGIFVSNYRFVIHDFFVYNFKNRWIKK